jgi:hypothetical protein
MNLLIVSAFLKCDFRIAFRIAYEYQITNANPYNIIKIVKIREFNGCMSFQA